MGIADVAASVRSGAVKAADLVEQHLAAIAARESEIHAFNHVMADEARAAAVAVDDAVARGDDPGPLTELVLFWRPGEVHHGKDYAPTPPPPTSILSKEYPAPACLSA